MIDRREREVVKALWSGGRLSRWELHERTGITPNGVGTVAAALMRRGLVRECAPESGPARAAGRPRVPLELDPARTHMIGVAISPGSVEVGRLGLSGQMIGAINTKRVEDPSRLVSTAASLLRATMGDGTLGVGVGVTGFVDPAKRTVLLSSSLPHCASSTLEPIFAAAGNDVPVVLENDMHALAAQWLLAHRAETSQDVLLVLIADGRMGAAMLIDGRPNRGCATGANDLGHARFFVDTQRCFCGHVGCLERIVSSEFLRRHDRAAGSSKHNGASLDERAQRFDASRADPSLQLMLDYLSCGLSNAINFMRPHRLVIVSTLARHAPFRDVLVQQTRGGMLSALADRVQVEFWNIASAGSAESAAWLAMAELLHGGWWRPEPA